jgi:hypothetical protein
MTTKVTKTTHKSTKQAPKPTQKRKTDATEIDDLFSTRTTKPTKPTKSTKPDKTAQPRPKDEIGDTRGKKKKARPLTDDGLPIFTAEEMGLNKGGDTADCPFDCSCCF